MPEPQDTSPRFATIIHLGAGEGGRLPEFRGLGARQVVLLEPAADAAKALERMTAGWAEARVVNAAVSARDGQAELCLWNLARLNSPAQAGPQLGELYPGLRQRARQSIRLLSPRSLLAEIGGIARPMLLVMETPGCERDILEGWKADGLLDQVDQLELHCPEEVLYEGAATRAELEGWLEEEGFVATSRDDDDPDWTILHLRADRRARALGRARADIAGHLETIAMQQEALTARDSALKEASGRIEALEAAHAQTCKERDKAFDDLGLALRMQGLLQADLDDLRERYRRSEEARTDQEALLRKLTPRLQEAAHQLRQLHLADAADTTAGGTKARSGRQG